MRTARVFLLASSSMLAVLSTTFASPPFPVSPAGISASVCPTFSWSERDGASGYQLVVYSLEETGEVAGGPLLSEWLPAGVQSWTPSAERCLVPGGNYAWLLRALGGSVPDEWSEPRLFSVLAGPTPEELTHAVEILRRHFGGQEGSRKPGVRTQPSVRESEVVGPRTGVILSLPEQSLAAAATAIRGELAATTGVSVGVAGVSNSPAGAGLAGANTDPGGGPDLLLDGAAQGVVDTLVTESGIDRPSASSETFDIGNSGVGTMTLRVDGVDVVTTSTDQDTLADLTCGVGQVAKWNDTAWTCQDDADSGGTVADVTATSPIASTGGTTPQISIPQATSSTSGYLSSGDWSAFDGKADSSHTHAATDVVSGILSEARLPGSLRVGFDARANSSQTLPSGSLTDLTLFGNEQFDLGGNHSSSTFTAPATGVYICTVNLYAPVLSGQFLLLIGGEYGVRDDSGFPGHVSVAKVLYLSASATVQVQVRQTSGSSWTIPANFYNNWGCARVS